MCLSKGTINNVQEGGTPTEWGKIFVVHVSDEGFLSRIKRSKSIWKWGKGVNCTWQKVDPDDPKTWKGAHPRELFCLILVYPTTHSSINLKLHQDVLLGSNWSFLSRILLAKVLLGDIVYIRKHTYNVGFFQC